MTFVDGLVAGCWGELSQGTARRSRGELGRYRKEDRQENQGWVDDMRRVQRKRFFHAAVAAEAVEAASYLSSKTQELALGRPSA